MTGGPPGQPVAAPAAPPCGPAHTCGPGGPASQVLAAEGHRAVHAALLRLRQAGHALHVSPGPWFLGGVGAYLVQQGLVAAHVRHCLPAGAPAARCGEHTCSCPALPCRPPATRRAAPALPPSICSPQDAGVLLLWQHAVPVPPAPGAPERPAAQGTHQPSAAPAAGRPAQGHGTGVPPPLLLPPLLSPCAAAGPALCAAHAAAAPGRPPRPPLAHPVRACPSQPPPPPASRLPLCAVCVCRDDGPADVEHRGHAQFPGVPRRRQDHNAHDARLARAVRVVRAAHAVRACCTRPRAGDACASPALPAVCALPWRRGCSPQPPASAPSPPCRCMRWYPQDRWTAGMSAEQAAAYNTASWFDMAVVPAALNLVRVPVCVCLCVLWAQLFSPDGSLGKRRGAGWSAQRGGLQACLSHASRHSDPPRRFLAPPCQTRGVCAGVGRGLLPHYFRAGQQAHPGAGLPKHVSALVPARWEGCPGTRAEGGGRAASGLKLGASAAAAPSCAVGMGALASYPCSHAMPRNHQLFLAHPHSPFLAARFTAMVERPSARKSALAKLVLSAPKPLQPLVYLGCARRCACGGLAGGAVCVTPPPCWGIRSVLPSCRRAAAAACPTHSRPPVHASLTLGACPPPSLPPCSLHTFTAWLSLLPTKLWFDSFVLHTAVLTGILLWSAWNGANYCEPRAAAAAAAAVMLLSPQPLPSVLPACQHRGPPASWWAATGQECRPARYSCPTRRCIFLT